MSKELSHSGEENARLVKLGVEQTIRGYHPDFGKKALFFINKKSAWLQLTPYDPFNTGG